MRKRKIIAVSVVALLGVVLVVYLMMRDTGPAIEVNGNLSAKDVAEIKSAVRRELWHDAWPNFSWKTIKGFPQGAKNALRTHVDSIDCGEQTGANKQKLALTVLSDGRVLIFIGGPNGWYPPGAQAGWTSYSPLVQTNGY